MSSLNCVVRALDFCNHIPTNFHFFIAEDGTWCFEKFCLGLCPNFWPVQMVHYDSLNTSVMRLLTNQ